MDEAQTEMHAVDVIEGGAALTLVLRIYGDSERLGSDPWYVPANEAAALRLLAHIDVPAPELVAEDLDGQHCGAPALLTTRLPGAPVIAPTDLDAFFERAAAVLPKIHAVEAEGLVPEYAPYVDPRELRPPGWTERHELWERVIDVVTGPVPGGERCFIHRDFHPWNLLWVEGELTGVVDWPTAAWGPPGIDLARMRLNLAREPGPEAAARFLEIAGPEGHHPYWDLLDATDGLAEDDRPTDAEEAAAWERLEAYLEQVLALT